MERLADAADEAAAADTRARLLGSPRRRRQSTRLRASATSAAATPAPTPGGSTRVADEQPQLRSTSGAKLASENGS